MFFDTGRRCGFQHGSPNPLFRNWGRALFAFRLEISAVLNLADCLVSVWQLFFRFSELVLTTFVDGVEVGVDALTQLRSIGTT